MYDGLMASVLFIASSSSAAATAPAEDASATTTSPSATSATTVSVTAGAVAAAEGPVAPAVAALPVESTAAAALDQDQPARPATHHLEVYGFVQTDAIQDFDRVDPDWEATLRPSKIPTTEGAFGSDGQTIFSVRQSRLGVRGNGEMAGRPYEVKFEFDLFGVGNDAGQTTFRPRHFYGRWGPLLVGQTNTLWMDGDIFPNVVDYWGPNGMVFVRTPQIRFTPIDDGHFSVAVAVEHLTDDIDAGAIRLIDPDLATNLRSNEELPDFTAMIRYGGDWGHVRLGGILRKIGYDTLGTVDNEPSGSETGWGVNATGSFKLSLATIRLGVVYGEGVASYMNDGGMDLAPTAALGPPVPAPLPIPIPPPNVLVEAEAVPILGVSGYVDLQWTSEISSAIGYSLVEVDNTNFQTGDAFHRGEYASANVLWAPDPRILTGLELLWGQRTDNDGSNGEDMRMQFTFKVSFSSDDLMRH